MNKVKEIVVFNTVSVYENPDIFIDANGLLNVRGTDGLKSYRATHVVVEPYTPETLQVTNVNISSVIDGAEYTLILSGLNKLTGLPYSKAFKVVAGTGATATTICDSFRSFISKDAYINVTVSGTSNLVLTGIAGKPTFGVISSDPKITSSVGLQGYPAIGIGSQIISSYPKSGFPPIGLIDPSAFYTAVTIKYEDVESYGEGSPLANNYDILKIFINESAPTYDFIFGDYGIITAYKQGYAASIGIINGTVSVEEDTGVITLDFGSASFPELMAQSGDWIILDASSSIFTQILGFDTDELTAIGTYTSALTVGDTLFVAWRNLPR
jgi:hypothetical protein